MNTHSLITVTLPVLLSVLCNGAVVDVTIYNIIKMEAAYPAQDTITYIHRHYCTREL